MRYYLSSFRLGAAPDALRAMAAGRPLAHVTNAADALAPADAAASNVADRERLEATGLTVAPCDLRDFAGDPERLARTLDGLGGLWVRDGNTFALRDAMVNAGPDTLLHRYARTRPDFLYPGYSAGACVLAPSLRPIALVDDPRLSQYGEHEPLLWQGLALLNTLIAPHYRSPHSESADIEHVVAWCVEHDVPHTPLCDGEVLLR